MAWHHGGTLTVVLLTCHFGNRYGTGLLTLVHTIPSAALAEHWELSRASCQ